MSESHNANGKEASEESEKREEGDVALPIRKADPLFRLHTNFISEPAQAIAYTK